MWPFSRICQTVNKPARATTTTIRILGSHTDSVLVMRQLSGRVYLFIYFFSAVFYNDVLCAEKLL